MMSTDEKVGGVQVKLGFRCDNQTDCRIEILALTVRNHGGWYTIVTSDKRSFHLRRFGRNCPIILSNVGKTFPKEAEGVYFHGPDGQSEKVSLNGDNGNHVQATLNDRVRTFFQNVAGSVIKAQGRDVSPEIVGQRTRG